MDEDDYVETSDVEELMAEQLDSKARQRSISYQTPPRKRIKLFHDSEPGAKYDPVAQPQHNGSSPIPPTASNISERSLNDAHDAEMHSLSGTQPMEDSQDPLLLYSPVSFAEPVFHPSPSPADIDQVGLTDFDAESTTPQNTPPRSCYPEMSPSLRYFSSRQDTLPAPTSIRTSPNPSSPKSSLPPSSPLSHLSYPSSPNPAVEDIPAPNSGPSPSRATSATSSVPLSSSAALPSSSPPGPDSPLPSVSLPLPTTVPEPQEIPPEIPPELLQEKRYTLRARNAWQQKPYTADKIMYEHQLRQNPEAIVSTKSLKRHHFSGDKQVGDDDEEDYPENNDVDETQDLDDEGFRKGHERRQKKQRAPEPELQPVIKYPGILGENISSDEEDDVTREARKLVRAEKRKQRKEEAQAKAASKIRPKKFPQPAPEVSGIPTDYFNQYDDDDEEEAPTVNPLDMHVDPPEPDDIQEVRRPSEVAEPVETPDDQDIEEPNSTQGFPQTADLCEVSDHPNYDVVPVNSQSDPEVEMDVHPRTGHKVRYKGRKIIGKLYPQSMVPDIMQATKPLYTKQGRQKSREAEQHSDTLLPGQSRIRRTENPKDISTIKGDTESSDDEPPSKKDVIDLTDSDQASEGYRSKTLPRRRLNKEKRVPIVHLVRDTSSSESDHISDEEMDMYMGPLRESNGSSAARQVSPVLRETSLIDYMLSRPARIGSKAKTKRQTGQPPSGGERKGSKYSLDITTNMRYGKEKQTLLSFSTHGTTKGGYRPRPDPSGSRKGSKKAGSRAAERSDNHDEESAREDNDAHTGFITTKKMGWKERKRRRKAKERGAGVYCFADGNGHLESGRARAAFITVNVEDEAFQRALVPRSIPTPVVAQRNPRQWPRLVNLDPELRQAAAPSPRRVVDDRIENRQPSPAPVLLEKTRVSLQSDMGMPAMPALQSFGRTSYTGSGYLHDLISTLSGTQAAPTLLNYSFLKFDLYPSMTLSDFCILIPKIFDAYLEFAADLPSPDTNDLCATWQKFGHVVHHYCTFYVCTPEPALIRTQLLECVNPQLTRVVKYFNELTPESVDLPHLQLYWFSLEMSLRLSGYDGLLPSVSAGTSKELVSCLMMLLFQFGFKDIIDGLRTGNELEGSPTSYRVAEIWVWLIHVMDPRRVTMSQPKHHPFWEPLKAVISTYIPSTGIQASEDFWSIIFSLCLMSQLNEYGMATSQPRLPACWELAVSALKKIHLDSPPDNSSESPHIRKQREAYIALLVARCTHLRERWQWKSATYDFLNVLSSIFKSRRYANLLNEPDDYPKFFRSKNWDGYSVYDPKDTAFAAFLKMIGHAIQDSVDPATGKPAMNLKKLTSMFLPVSSLSFSKANPPGPRAMGMLYNRICGAAVAVHLDPTDYDSKMTQARKYVSFADVDDDVRLSIIRGLMAWGVMMVSDKVGLSGIVAWATEIAEVLCEELRAIKAEEAAAESPQVKLKRRNLVLLTVGLIGALRQIATAHIPISAYPEPGLIGCLKNLITTWLFRTDSPSEEFLRLNHFFFEARIIALPPPERPPKPDEPESQEFQVENIEVDWSMADLPDALKGDTPVDYKEKEQALGSVVRDSNYKWKLLHFLSVSLRKDVSAHKFNDHAKVCDSWTKAWVSCTFLTGQDGADKWTRCLAWIASVFNNTSNKIWVRRMELGFYYYVLLLEPMAYCLSGLKHEFIKCLLNSLVSSHHDMESRYVALLLSIDGLQHPLLRNIDCLPNPSRPNGDYDFQDNFKDLQLPLLRAVFRNIHRHLTIPDDNLTGTLEINKCMDYCTHTLSTLRNNQMKFPMDPELESERQEYVQFCGEVVDACLEFSSIRSRLSSSGGDSSFWSDWRRNLPVRT